MSNKYDIFISYRRKDAGDKAEHLKDLLEPYYKDRSCKGLFACYWQKLSLL